MATCREIITLALKKVRVYEPGGTPNADEMADGLDELQNLYEQWISGGMFGHLADVLTNAAYDAAPGERIVATDSAVVTLPATVSEDGADYPPYALSAIEVIDTVAATVKRYIYENGAWVAIGALTLDNTAPLSGRGRSGLAACLAMSLAEMYGAEVGPGALRQANSFKTALALKLGSDTLRTAQDYF